VGARRRVGAVVAVALGPEQYGFARVLPEPLVEFFDFRALHPDIPMTELGQARVAFRILTMNAPITSGRWPKIGEIPANQLPWPAVRFCQQDALSRRLSIYELRPDGSRETYLDASTADCEGLERYAVWSQSHVEDRLRDHFAGRANKWLESLRLTD
jgi:hypothetical protein